DALKKADHVLCVLTQAFLDSVWCKEEWTNAIDQLIPVRVADVQPDGLLTNHIYINLFGLPEDEAREKLLADIKGQVRPTTKPPFPPTECKPAFPNKSLSPTASHSDSATSNRQT
ncbi:MAG: toll/interleukin-1 receptor domain-containing protein, partial [Planctomycetaceae bacterium]|nr:toll/interleukin-1 receptor domain-containing protein [Planctomycetaceae bacterium]